MKRLDEVKKRLNELIEKRVKLDAELEQLKDKLSAATVAYATGEGTQKAINEARDKVKAKESELVELDELISQVKKVKTKALVESLPVISQMIDAKVKKRQEEYDKQAERVKAARNAFLIELHKLGMLGEPVSVGNDYREAVEAKGGKVSFYDSHRQISKSPLFYYEHGMNPQKNKFKAVGVTEFIQKQVYDGHLPDWVTGESK